MSSIFSSPPARRAFPRGQCSRTPTCSSIRTGSASDCGTARKIASACRCRFTTASAAYWGPSSVPSTARRSSCRRRLRTPARHSPPWLPNVAPRSTACRRSSSPCHLGPRAEPHVAQALGRRQLLLEDRPHRLDVVRPIGPLGVPEHRADLSSSARRARLAGGRERARQHHAELVRHADEAEGAGAAGEGEVAVLR